MAPTHSSPHSRARCSTYGRLSPQSFLPPQRGYSRETVLLGCFGLVFVLFALTAFVARMYRKEVHALADQWFAKGEAAFRAGDAEEAVRDYRNALVYSPSNPAFQLHLAQALTAAHKDNEARSYLLNLLAESPGNGEINLELARIAARSRDNTSAQITPGDTTDDAMRYYYGAIYGVWDSNPIQMRWNARKELCVYLLARGNLDQAQREIIALAQDVPPGDIARQKQAADLLVRVKLWNGALEEYRSILVARKHDEDALAGAAIAAFNAGQYALAVRYFEQLSPQKRADPQISSMFHTSRDIEAANPFLPELSNQERARRAAHALARAESLLTRCLQRQTSQSSQPAQPTPAPSPQPPPSSQASSTTPQAAPSASLQNLQDAFTQNSSAWSLRALTRNPTSIDIAMTWVFKVEDTVAQICGPSPDPVDRALLLIAQSRPGPQS